MDSRLLVVGDMPRREDDRAGNPFVGQDGQLLRATIGEACHRLGVDPTKVYYTSAIRCRTPQQRPPEELELEQCLSWLVEEIDTIKPVCVLAVGATAQAQVDLALNGGYPVDDGRLKRAYHPAFILKNKQKLPLWQKQVEEAVRRAFCLDAPEVIETRQSNWTLGSPDMSSPWLSADTEFDDLEEQSGTRMVGWSISDGVSADFYSVQDMEGLRLPGEEVQRKPSDYFPRTKIHAHNIKSDADHLGVDLHDRDSWEDTMLQAYCTRKFKYVGLKKLAPELAGVDWPISIKELLREYTPSGQVFKSGPRKGLDKPGKWKSVPFSRALAVRPDECRSYAATDALATARIAQRLVPMLDAEGAWARHYYETFEKPLVPVLLKMEQAGVRINPGALNDAAGVILLARERTEAQLRSTFGPELSLGSNQQMAPVLLDLGLIDGKLTESGELGCAKGNILGAFNVEKIEDLPPTPEGQIARDLLEWRQMGKLKSTYVDAILSRLDSESRVHGRYNQAVTNTNRLSSSDPNLQNIPARSDIGLAIRKAFIPREGSVFVGGDFSNLQLRIYGHITQEQVFLDTYGAQAKATRGCAEDCKCTSCDFHQNVATQMNRPRSVIKNFVFAVMKGAEVQKAAATAGVPQDQASAFMSSLRLTIPSFLTFKVLISDTLMQQGYVESLMGWRMYYPDILSTVRKWQSAAVREASDGIIQSSEAGLVKAFMVEVYKELREYFPDYRLVLVVHDELWAEGPPEQAEEVMAMMRQVAVTVAKRWVTTVPIRFDTKVVTNWGLAK